MRRGLVVVLIAVAALASGAVLGLELDSGESAAPVPTGLPAAVEQTRAALLQAAETGDYEALAPHMPDGFRYTFGVGEQGGAPDYWQELERTTGERPLEHTSGRGPIRSRAPTISPRTRCSCSRRSDPLVGSSPRGPGTSGGEPA